MRFEIGIESLATNRRRHAVAFFQFGYVFRRRNTADNSIGPVRKWCLVDDRIEDVRLDATLFAPVLRKDVMDIDVLSKEDRGFWPERKSCAPSFIKRALTPL